jgi:Raf kinase inhibitor-like YbhB/YbcL family protein
MTKTTKTDIRLRITSPAFTEGGEIPIQYTCDGEDINPPLHIFGYPNGTRSLAMIVDDPDAPGKTWVHWVVWNIVPTDLIGENMVPGEQGWNDFGQVNYGGPCPPSGTHRYFFKVYALDRMLELAPGSSKQDLLEAMGQDILATGQLMGTYSRD